MCTRKRIHILFTILKLFSQITYLSQLEKMNCMILMKTNDLVQVNLCQKLLFLHQLTGNPQYDNRLFMVKFHEQSFVMWLVSWCKNKCFRKRFTCKKEYYFFATKEILHDQNCQENSLFLGGTICFKLGWKPDHIAVKFPWSLSNITQSQFNSQDERSSWKLSFAH